MTIDEAINPATMPRVMDSNELSLDPSTKAWANIKSLISSPIPSSLFGVQISDIADHARNRLPKRWIRVNRGPVATPAIWSKAPGLSLRV